MKLVFMVHVEVNAQSFLLDHPMATVPLMVKAIQEEIQSNLDSVDGDLALVDAQILLLSIVGDK